MKGHEQLASQLGAHDGGSPPEEIDLHTLWSNFRSIDQKAEWFRLDEPLPMRPGSVAQQLVHRLKR